MASGRAGMVRGVSVAGVATSCSGAACGGWVGMWGEEKMMMGNEKQGFAGMRVRGMRKMRLPSKHE